MGSNDCTHALIPMCSCIITAGDVTDGGANTREHGSKWMGRRTKMLKMNRWLISNVTQYREELRDQHALGEEIANAITSAPIGEAVDQDELDEELASLEQEALDDKMLSQGTTVPVNDRVANLPVAGNGECKSIHLSFLLSCYRRRTSSFIYILGSVDKGEGGCLFRCCGNCYPVLEEKDDARGMRTGGVSMMREKREEQRRVEEGSGRSEPGEM